MESGRIPGCLVVQLPNMEVWSVVDVPVVCHSAGDLSRVAGADLERGTRGPIMNWGLKDVTDETLIQLWKSVLISPAEDTVRLALADRLDDVGGAINTAYAQFIRDSIALHDVGDIRETVHTILVPRGPDYYEMVDAEYSGVRVGMRIDVQPIAISRKTKTKPHHGLLVTKVQVDDPELETIRVSLKKDEYSVPFDQKRYNTLTKSVETLWRKHHPDFFGDCFLPPGFTYRDTPYNLFGVQTGIMGYYASLYSSPWGHSIICMQRGFLDSVAASWGMWDINGADLVNRNPITRVHFIDEPQESMAECHERWPCVVKWVYNGEWE